jgi:hypothetical protein
MKACILSLIALAGLLGASQTVMASDRGYATVAPGTTDILTARITGQQWVTIGLVGDGGTDLDLYVYDPFGQLVARDEGQTDNGLVRFWAVYTGSYTVRVVNRSNLYSNTYVIAID